MKILKLDNRSIVSKNAGRVALFCLLLSAVACAPTTDGFDTTADEDSDEEVAALGNKGAVRGVEFVSFSSLSAEVTDFKNVSAKYIVYSESHGRNGHNDINKDQDGFVDVVGAQLIGYGGGRDKYLALFKVTSPNVKIDKNGGSGQALFVKTSKTLTVIEAKSIDPEIGAKKVPGAPANDEIVVYAEDEGGKGTRDQFYMPRAFEYFGSGDDLLYVFASNSVTEPGAPNGNGAYMRLKIQ